jgi:competence protein ComEA
MSFAYPQKIILCAVVVLGLIGGGYFLSKNFSGEPITVNSDLVAEKSLPGDGTNNYGTGEVASPPSAARLVVFVAGAVKNSGVVTLKSGARVLDAVVAAGGLTDQADVSLINFAQKVNDGQRLEIPCFKIVSPPSGGMVTPGVAGLPKGSLVNINSATAAELQTIKGIGKKISQEIVSYREKNGRFKTLEDLKAVKGIGEAKFNLLKGSITL